jgi:phosphoribosylformylglycinamidine (FGAM) synthase PurS component
MIGVTHAIACYNSALEYLENDEDNQLTQFSHCLDLLGEAYTCLVEMKLHAVNWTSSNVMVKQPFESTAAGIDYYVCICLVTHSLIRLTMACEDPNSVKNPQELCVVLMVLLDRFKRMCKQATDPNGNSLEEEKHGLGMDHVSDVATVLCILLYLSHNNNDVISASDVVIIDAYLEKVKHSTSRIDTIVSRFAKRKLALSVTASSLSGLSIASNTTTPTADSGAVSGIELYDLIGKCLVSKVEDVMKIPVVPFVDMELYDSFGAASFGINV